MAAARPGLAAALAELQEETLLHAADRATPDRGRRAAVFYLDRGSGSLAMVRWWLHAWRLIGLDQEAEQFDLVLQPPLALGGLQLCPAGAADPPRLGPLPPARLPAGGGHCAAHRARALPLQTLPGDQVPGQHLRQLHEQPGVPGGARHRVPCWVPFTALTLGRQE